MSGMVQAEHREQRVSLLARIRDRRNPLAPGPRRDLAFMAGPVSGVQILSCHFVPMNPQPRGRSHSIRYRSAYRPS